MILDATRNGDTTVGPLLVDHTIFSIVEELYLQLTRRLSVWSTLVSLVLAIGRGRARPKQEHKIRAPSAQAVVR